MSRYANKNVGIKRGKSPESAFSNKLRKHLAVIFPKSRWWKNHGSEFSERGLSDICGVINGTMIAIEVKYWRENSGGWFSPHQFAFLQDINRAGGVGIGLLRKGDGVYIIPTTAMNHKGDRKRNLWTKLDKYPESLAIIEFANGG